MSPIVSQESEWRKLLLYGAVMKIFKNPSVPDTHYSERQDKLFSLQIQPLEVDTFFLRRKEQLADVEKIGSKLQLFYEVRFCII